MNVQAIKAAILPDPLRASLGAARAQINSRVLGKEREVRLAFTTLLAGGHLLIETSVDQAPLTVDAFRRGGLTAGVRRAEDVDGTVVIGGHAG